MRGTRRLVVVGVGLLAGIVASLAMVLAMLAMRTWLGVSPPFEALPDRFAPTLDIPTFFSLFGRFGGYNGLKRFGITSGLAGLFALGAVIGMAYAAVVEGVRSRLIDEFQILDFARDGHLTSPEGAAYGSSGIIINCPIVMRLL